MPYFEIVDFAWRREERWHLREPASHDGKKEFTWSFTRCEPFKPRIPLRIGIRNDGAVVDFTLADFEIPVLSPRAVEILSSQLAEFCEFIPVDIIGQPSGFAILNILRSEDCVDESASELLIWKPTDARPDKAGQYRQVSRLVLKSDFRGPPIFRLAKFKMKVLVSDSIAELFRRQHLSGVSLEER